MFLLVLAVPTLLVVVLGYVVGHGVWSAVAGLVGGSTGTTMAAGAEPAGWVTGALFLALVVRLAVVVRRRRQGR